MCKEKDFMANYSRALLHCGLLDLAMRDMVREGDGNAMIVMWKVNMLQFWKNGYNKYMILDHRYLAGKLAQNMSICHW